MCGIFFVHVPDGIRGSTKQCICKCFNAIQHRGPDESRLRYERSDIAIGFHRLGIIDPDAESSMQPFLGSKSKFGPKAQTRFVCVVNGEIYNWRELRAELVSIGYVFNTESDCEVVIRMFEHLVDLDESRGLNKSRSAYPCETLCQLLDGEFAFIILDLVSETVYYGTDELSTRPLFICAGANYFAIASEQKALIGLDELSHGIMSYAKPNIVRVPPGTWTAHPLNAERASDEIYGRREYFNFAPGPVTNPQFELTFADAADVLYQKIVRSVDSKSESDRDCIFLLSGGLDSSIICGVYARSSRNRIHTFTFGFSDGPPAPDIVAAQSVATHIKSIHTPVLCTYADGIAAIPSVVQSLETWDQTSVRAGTPMILVLRRAKQMHPEVAVVFSGEVSDEVFAGYLENLNAPDSSAVRANISHRLRNICFFDGLRADRCAASVSCEIRFPFFDAEILNFIFGLPETYIDPRCNGGVEKALLRAAFRGRGIIPDHIVDRTKNAFSDATSTLTSSGSEWKEKLKAAANTHVTDSRFAARAELYPYQTPQTKEDMWYREIFDECGYDATTIPFKWMPNWASPESTDSSATILDVYNRGS